MFWAVTDFSQVYVILRQAGSPLTLVHCRRLIGLDYMRQKPETRTKPSEANTNQGLLQIPMWRTAHGSDFACHKSSTDYLVNS